MDSTKAEQVRRWIQGLKRRDPLRMAVEAHLAGERIGQDMVALALDRLKKPGRFRWQAVALAAWILGHGEFTSEERERALPLLRRAAARPVHRGPIRATMRGALKGSLFLTPLALGLLAESTGLGDFEFGLFWGLSLILGFLVVCATLLAIPLILILMTRGILTDLEEGNHIRAAAVATLGRLKDFETLGVAARGACASTEELAASGSQTRIEIIAQITAEQYGAVPSQTVPRLCATLVAHTTFKGRASWQNVRLALAILDTLERVGDGRAVEAVRLVAESGMYRSVKERAAEVLPVLVARKEQEEAPQRLLRASEAPDSAALLRPATGIADTPPEQLLRPAQHPD